MHDALDASALGEDAAEIDEAAQDEVNRVLYELTDGAWRLAYGRQAGRSRGGASACAFGRQRVPGKRGRHRVARADAKGPPGATAGIDTWHTPLTGGLGHFQLVKYMWTLRPSIRVADGPDAGLYVDENLVTERVASAMACFDSSPGRIKRTAVWISREEMVLFLL